MITALVLSTALLFGATPATPDPVFPRGLPYALYEDGCSEGVKRCVWNARTQGNGIGAFSVLFTRYEGGFLVRPISHRRADRLHAAYCERPNVTCEGYFD